MGSTRGISGGSGGMTGRQYIRRSGGGGEFQRGRQIPAWGGVFRQGGGDFKVRGSIRG